MTQAIMTRESVRTLLDKQKSEIVRALPNHIDADTFTRVFLTAINKTPKLLECSQTSLLQSMMDLAQLGLVADSVLGLAYLIPFDDKKRGMICQLIVGYQGYIDLAYRHPKVKAINWQVVHAKDRFDYIEGLEPRLIHVPCDDDDPGPLVKAYAICELDSGGKTWAVLNRREIMKAKASSRGAGSEYSPWNQWEEQMWSKTAVKAMLKKVPKSRDLELAYTRDSEDVVIDVQSATANASPIINVGALPEPPTEGETLAAEVRREANTLTPEERAALEVKGREIIGAKPETPPAKPKKPKAEPAPAPKPADPRIVPAPEGGGTPPPDLFEESEDHVKLRELMAGSNISEANFLDYARGEGLIEDHVNSLPMIPQKRIRTFVMSWDQVIAELTGKR